MRRIKTRYLPGGFVFPGAFGRLVDRRLTDLEPCSSWKANNSWVDISDWPADFRAVRSCRLGERQVFPDVYGWLRQAVEDMIEFDRFES